MSAPLATKTVGISPEVHDVLSRGEWHGAMFKLPAGQLARPLYEATDKVLKALGGKWHRNCGGHLFATPEAADSLRAALANGHAIDHKRSLEQFWTPPEVVAALFDLADDVEGTDVLEPSAGKGAIALEAMRRGATVTAIEIDSDLVSALCSESEGRMNIACADFLAWALRLSPKVQPYDFVLMNPPFSRGQDIAHVRRAFGFLKPGGTLVSVMSPHWTFATDRASREFADWTDEADSQWTALPDGAFKQEGTGVNSGLLKMIKGDG